MFSAGGNSGSLLPGGYGAECLMGVEKMAMSSENVIRGLAGLRLLSLESRRADQMAKLIEGRRRRGSVYARDPSRGQLGRVVLRRKPFRRKNLMS